MSDHALVDPVGRNPAEPKSAERAERLHRLLTYSLTTAEILYHMPDHPALLQSYIWQDYDLAPKFPGLHKFLGFWESSLDGRLHSVRVVSARLLSPAEYRAAAASYDLH